MKTGSRVAIVLSVVLVFSMVAPPALAASPPDNETFSTNGVDVWEESIFTLRHDFKEAPTSIKTGSFFAGLGDEDAASLNRDYVGTRTAGDTVTLTFDTTKVVRSDTDITGNQMQVFAARVTGSGEPVTTFSEAIDLISKDNANTNATFEPVEESVSIADGETSVSHTGDAGHYVYFAVDRETGSFDITDGNIEIEDGTPTIIGVEQISFQRGSPSSVAAPDVAEPGDDLSFDIDTTNQFDQDDVTHTVLVYEEETFSDINEGEFRINVTDRSEINSEFNLSEDAILEHEINEVNGVADVEDGIEVNGIDISDGRVSRSVSLGSVVDFVAEDINANPPSDTIGTMDEGEVRLDASVTAVAQERPNQTVTVETADNWTSGEYRYVYIGALESNASAVTTDTGKISIQSGIDESLTVNRDEVETVRSASESGGAASVPSLVGNVTEADFSGLAPGSTVTVAPLKGRPSKIASNKVPDANVNTYIELNATPDTPGGTATVNLTLSQSQFDDFNNAQIFRYNDTSGEFEGVNIISRTPQGNDVVIQFETRFSTFAIGEGSGGSSGGGTTPSASSSGGGGGGGSLSTGFTVSDLDPQDVEVTQGDTITVTATVTTDSYLEETQEVAFQIDGEIIESQQVTLSSQESTTVEFTGIDTSNLEGEYEHGIVTDDDSQTATLTVTVPTDAEDDTAADEETDGEAAEEEATEEEETAPDEETQDGTPGFGPLVALVALIAAAILATRREDRN